MDVADDWETLPSPTTQTSATTTPSTNAAQISKVPLMKFCPYDSSMLYPREVVSSKRLAYGCKLCDYISPPTDISTANLVQSNNLIYRNRLKKEREDVLANVLSTLVDDPTLARSSATNCEKCGFNEAVFFQSTEKGMDSLALIFICCECGHKWVS